jgi:hypothetical protein
MTQPLPKLQLSQPLLEKKQIGNRIYTSQINNDYIYKNVNTIYYKHNIHSSLQGIEEMVSKYMNLLE